MLGGERRPRAAFTLIELIVVMAMLIIAVALVTPRLVAFFNGRTLDAEARRLITLTQYAQSRAVSEGFPMILWLDAKSRSYGLQVQPGYLTDFDAKAVSYELAEHLELEIESTPLLLRFRSTALSQSIPPNVPTMRFTPDGFIGWSSPETIRIRDERQFATIIGLSRNRLYYEIQTNNPTTSMF